MLRALVGLQTAAGLVKHSFPRFAFERMMQAGAGACNRIALAMQLLSVNQHLLTKQVDQLNLRACRCSAADDLRGKAVELQPRQQRPPFRLHSGQSRHLTPHLGLWLCSDGQPCQVSWQQYCCTPAPAHQQVSLCHSM